VLACGCCLRTKRQTEQQAGENGSIVFRARHLFLFRFFFRSQ
jgi:hypothetical protein